MKRISKVWLYFPLLETCSNVTTAPVYVFYFSILWRLEPGLSVIVQEAKLIRMGNIRECQARDNRQKDCCSFEHDSTDNS